MQSGNQSTALVEFFNYRLASDDGSGDIIVGYRYEYDNGGNITDIKAEVDGALIPLEHYEYDEKQGQLKEAIRYENGVEADRWTYSYDTAGNILSEDHEGSNSELHEYAYEDGRWGDLLTSVDGIDLEYDGSGNPTLYANGTELLWSMECQPRVHRARQHDRGRPRFRLRRKRHPHEKDRYAEYLPPRSDL
jgi:YD repeat-containing protein